MGIISSLTMNTKIDLTIVDLTAEKARREIGKCGGGNCCSGEE